MLIYVQKTSRTLTSFYCIWLILVPVWLDSVIMRPSSLGGGRILRRTLSVCLSVCLSVRLSVRPVIVFVYFTVEPSYERTSKIEKLLFSLMCQRHVCTFRLAQRAAYRTAISAAQTCLYQASRPIKQHI